MRDEEESGSPAGPGSNRTLPVVEDELSRRAFVKILGASVAVAGLGACERPEARIFPYVQQPPELVPGVPRSYATAMVLGGHATGLLVQTREGRPVKVEGNPRHPASLGATGVHEQAYLLQLYDASRGTEILGPEGAPATRRRLLDEFVTDASEEDGGGLHVLLEPTSSPTRIRLLDRLQESLPGASVHFHSPVGPSRAIEAYQRLAGRPLVPRYRFDRARTVVAMDADFVSSMPFHLRYARDFAAERTVAAPGDGMNRLYVAEPSPTAVAAVADHHLPVRAGDVAFLMAALVRALDGELPGMAPAPSRLGSERVRAWTRAAAEDLLTNPGEGVVVVGETQPPAVHAMAHRANQIIGAMDRTVILQESVLRDAAEIRGGLERLSAAAAAGEVDTLVILGGNPLYTAAADLEPGSLMESPSRTLYLGPHRNETARASDWYVPALHGFERWGDARAYDGTLTPVQPLIRPLHGGSSVEELLATFAGEPNADPYERVREMWREMAVGDPDTFWREALSRGLVEGTEAPEVPASSVSVSPDALGELVAELDPPGDGPEVAFRADPRVHDGRFANNAWLQELPDPATTLTWGNAALLSPRTARALGVERGDAVRIASEGREVVIPALPTPGHADDAVTLSLGYGRAGDEAVARGIGVNAYRIRTTERPWSAPMELSPAPEEGAVELALAQPEWRLHDRSAVLQHHTLAEFREDPELVASHRGAVRSAYQPPDIRPSEHQWAMTVDLSICTGCGACTVACQAENNIPVVGPEGVKDGRIMHWIRIDRYVEHAEDAEVSTGGGSEADSPGSPGVGEVGGFPDPPLTHLRQPMLCQHCEKAPCEYVCPVNATVHSADGLNEMVYNRCIGTRFCSNNCPYKVRRFNWFDYNEQREPVEALVLNPDVTVRDRGVMEKCTYCVQRIRRSENRARVEERQLEPDEVTTACAQACPTRAITFGDLNADGALSRTRGDPRIYEVLHELGTRPRTQYLTKLTNPNAALRAAASPASDGERSEA